MSAYLLGYLLKLLADWWLPVSLSLAFVQSPGDAGAVPRRPDRLGRVAVAIWLAHNEIAEPSECRHLSVPTSEGDWHANMSWMRDRYSYIWDAPPASADAPFLRFSTDEAKRLLDLNRKTQQWLKERMPLYPQDQALFTDLLWDLQRRERAWYALWDMLGTKHVAFRRRELKTLREQVGDAFFVTGLMPLPVPLEMYEVH